MVPVVARKTPVGRSVEPATYSAEKVPGPPLAEMR